MTLPHEQLKKMEAKNVGRTEPLIGTEETQEKGIRARAIISCSKCKTKKIFRNVILRKNLELLVVTLKILDWMTCEKCGGIIQLEMEFEI